jgi:GT2 family glycosyltransferase
MVGTQGLLSKASREKIKMQLQAFEELRLHAYESSRIYTERMKLYHDKKLVKKEFQPGQFVFLLNSRLRFFLGKLKSKWSGPF